MPQTASAIPSSTAIKTPKISTRKFSARGDLAAGASAIGLLVLGTSVNQRKSSKFATGTKNKNIQPGRSPASRSRRRVSAIPIQKNGIAIAHKIAYISGRRSPRSKIEIWLAGRT